MATYTTKEDMFFAECCPITIFRDGTPILAVVGELGPADGATDADRAFAEEVRRTLSAAPDMLAALYDAEARLWEVLADDPAASQFNETVKVVRAAIAKAEGRVDS